MRFDYITLNFYLNISLVTYILLTCNIQSPFLFYSKSESKHFFLSLCLFYSHKVKYMNYLESNNVNVFLYVYQYQFFVWMTWTEWKVYAFYRDLLLNLAIELNKKNKQWCCWYWIFSSLPALPTPPSQTKCKIKLSTNQCAFSTKWTQENIFW